MLHGSEHECYSLTTPESLSLKAMSDHGRFPGPSPKSLILVPTQFRIQDASRNPRIFVSAPPPRLTSRRRLVKFPVERGGDLGHTLASASNLPGDLDEVTLIQPISYCAGGCLRWTGRELINILWLVGQKLQPVAPASHL